MVAVLAFLPDFAHSIVPVHDSRQSWSAFHTFCSTLYFDHDLPLWLPYGRYGTSSTLLMMYLSPMAFAGAVIGKLFSIESSLVLYKGILLSELLILVAGTHVLVRELFRSREARFLVLLGVILSFSWLVNPSTNLHAYYLLPLIFHCLLQFHKTGKISSLLTAGIFSAFNSIGNSPYFGPLLALMVVIFVGILYAQKPLKIRDLKWSRWNVLQFLVFAIVAAAFVTFMSRGFAGLTSLSEGRDPATSRVFKSVFLTHGGISKLPQLLLEYLTGAHLYGDNTFYVGLLPLVLAPLAMLKCARPEFRAFAGLAVALVLFSFGGLFSWGAYHFPTMAFYRHIGLVFGPVKWLLLVMAGFGVEAVLDRAPRVKFGIVYLIVALWFLGESIYSVLNPAPYFQYVLLPKVDLVSWEALTPFLARATWYSGLTLTAYLLYRQKEWRSLSWNLLLVAFAGDLLSFRARILENWPRLDEKGEAYLATVEKITPVEFRGSRVDVAKLEATHAKIQFWWRAPFYNDVTTYGHIYSASDADPCFPLFRTDHVSNPLSEIFALRTRSLYYIPETDSFPPEDKWLRTAVGCEQSKLRLVDFAQILFVPASEGPRTIAKLSRNDTRLVMVDAVSRSAQSVGQEALPHTEKGAIVVSSFSRNFLKAEVTVTGVAPQFLYYADAFHPGWRAWLDGQPTSILRGNSAFKAIEVPPGKHHIELRFFDGLGSIAFYVLFFTSLGFVVWFVTVYIAVPFLGENDGLPELRERHARAGTRSGATTLG